MLNAEQIKAMQREMSLPIVATERAKVEESIRLAISMQQTYACHFSHLSEATIQSLAKDGILVEHQTGCDSGKSYITSWYRITWP